MQTLWYSEATLFLNGNLVRAGTLIQCARKWAAMSAADQSLATMKLAVALDGENALTAGQIAALASRPGYLRA